MSTKSDLLKAWSTLAVEDIAEVRHRIRALSEAGLLPTRKQPLEYVDLARAIIGFTATAQHKDAPEAVRFYSDFRCKSHRWLVGGPHSEAKRVVGQTLLEALVLALRSPLRVMQFEVNTTDLTATLKVGEGYRTVRTQSGRDGLITGNVISCYFEAQATLPLRLMKRQLNITRSFYFPFIDPLLTQLMGHPEPPQYGSIVRADSDLIETEHKAQVSTPKVPKQKRRLK